MALPLPLPLGLGIPFLSGVAARLDLVVGSDREAPVGIGFGAGAGVVSFAGAGALMIDLGWVCCWLGGFDVCDGCNSEAGPSPSAFCLFEASPVA